jgi:hypothetical protein
MLLIKCKNKKKNARTSFFRIFAAKLKLKKYEEVSIQQRR